MKSNSTDRAVSAWEETVTLPTYPPPAADLNPMFLEHRVNQGTSGRVYPNPFTDGVSSEREDAAYRAVFLENEYLRLTMLPQIGGPTILHICGKCLDRVPLITTEGYDGYHFEWKNDPKKVVEAAQGKISLLGGIGNIEGLLQGTPDDVYQQARYNIEAGVDSIGPECAISLQTSVANLKAIVAAAEEGY